MKMHAFSRILLVSFVFLLCGCGSGRLAVQYKFDEGKLYRYSTTVDSKVVGQTMGQEFNMTSVITLDYSLKIQEKKEHLLKLTATITQFAVQNNFPMMGLNDSTIVMSEYNGKRMQVLMTERGKTLSVVPLDAIPPSRVLVMTGSMPIDLLKQLFLELPDSELEVNRSWKKTYPDTITRSGMKMVMKPNIDYKIIGVENKSDYSCWKILISGSNLMEGSGSQGGNDVNADGTIKINGTSFIAPEKGILVSSEQSIDNDLTTIVAGSQIGASTMLIKTTIKSRLVQ